MSEIWCMTGLPGSGKSTLGKTLSEEGCAILERDNFYDEVEKGITGIGNELISTLQKLDTAEEKEGEEIDQLNARSFQLVEILRTRVKELANLIKEFNCGREELTFVEKLATESPEKLVEALFAEDGELRKNIVRSLAYYRTIDEAVNKQGENPPVIINTFFIVKRTREETRRILNENRMSPCLIIVQQTERKLMEVAKLREERGETEGNRAHPSQADLASFLENNDPYSPTEGWDKVVVVDQSPGQSSKQPAKGSLRQLMANATKPAPSAPPISFLAA